MHPSTHRPGTVVVATTQFACSWDLDASLAAAERLIRAAAAAGAQIIALPELFATPYFCQTLDDHHFALARTISEDPAITLAQQLANELDVVLPISTFERSGQEYFNSLTVVDAGGAIMGTYRKTHIPEGRGYHEKFYFSPGDTGFRAWETAYARICVGVCWDQWFVESARAMALDGAELLIFPTAIGSSPYGPGAIKAGVPRDLEDAEKRHSHWQTVQRGHAAANMMPVIAANRIGTESQGDTRIDFFGQSFIANQRGEVVASLTASNEGFVMHEFDRDQLRAQRASWGLFRDRRPEMYRVIAP